MAGNEEGALWSIFGYLISGLVIWGAKNAKSKTKVVDEFLLGLYPSINAEELVLLKSQLDKESLKQLGKDAGLSDSELKELVEDGKKLERDS